MTAQIAFVYLLLALTIGAFIIDRWRMDMVALMVVIVLALSGIITPGEAVAGFGNTIVVMIAALFVVGEGIFRTGVAGYIGQFLLKIGGHSELRLLMVLLPMVSLLSTSISSTGTVALLIPIVMTMARKAGLHPSRLLMPVALITLVAGMTTLIGTPPNIIASGALREAGHAGFTFFEFMPVGGIILLVCLILMLTVGRMLLPNRPPVDADSERASLEDFAQRYMISGHLHKLRIGADSPVIGQTVTALQWRRAFNRTLFAILRQGDSPNTLVLVMLNTEIAQYDTLWIYGHSDDDGRYCRIVGIRDTNRITG